MAFLEFNKEDLCTTFVQNLLVTNRGFNYYVDWANITGFEQFIVEIHAMDALIGCKDDELFFERFHDLMDKIPSVTTLFPFLFGLAKEERKKLYKATESLLIIQDELDNQDYLEFYFQKINEGITMAEEDIKSYYWFFTKMGLKNLYQNIIEKSTYDYIVGVLVGLDSNGRKNRGGKAFELACQPLFMNICKKNNLKLLIQKKFKILKKLGFVISDDIKERKADFIIVDTKQRKAINFEVNFYNGTGSKPEEIIDSYINRQNDLEKVGIDFALVTDGKKCWENASNQLQKGFRRLDYLLNFYLLKHGMLEEIVKKVFNI